MAWRLKFFIDRSIPVINCLLALVLGFLIGQLNPLKYGQARYSDHVKEIQEYDRLKATYGPARYSEYEEEWIIQDFFQGKRGGFFIDVGAHHYKNFSNSYYLENALDWSGIAVEPQQQFQADYIKYRPRTRFFPVFLSDFSNETARLYVAEGNTRVTSAHKEFTQRYNPEPKEISAPTITLTELLDREQVKNIDLLSIDVELHEPKVLAGFDIERFKPALVCIEAKPEVRTPILDYFAQHGYVVVGKYLRVDIKNLYFAPLAKADSIFSNK
jgi:FkbM family methyltransferase